MSELKLELSEDEVAYLRVTLTGNVCQVRAIVNRGDDDDDEDWTVAKTMLAAGESILAKLNTPDTTTPPAAAPEGDG